MHVLETRSFIVQEEMDNEWAISNKYEAAPLTPDFASIIMLVTLINFACKAKTYAKEKARYWNTNKLSTNFDIHSIRNIRLCL